MTNAKKTYDCCLKKFLLFYNTLVLVAWLYVEALMAYHLYSQTRKGFKLDFGLLHKVDMWSYVNSSVKAAIVLNSFNLLFFLGKSSHIIIFQTPNPPRVCFYLSCFIT